MENDSILEKMIHTVLTSTFNINVHSRDQQYVLIDIFCPSKTHLASSKTIKLRHVINLQGVGPLLILTKAIVLQLLQGPNHNHT